MNPSISNILSILCNIYIHKTRVTAVGIYRRVPTRHGNSNVFVIKICIYVPRIVPHLREFFPPLAIPFSSFSPLVVTPRTAPHVSSRITPQHACDSGGCGQRLTTSCGMGGGRWRRSGKACGFMTYHSPYQHRPQQAKFSELPAYVNTTVPPNATQ